MVADRTSGGARRLLFFAGAKTSRLGAEQNSAASIRCAAVAKAQRSCRIGTIVPRYAMARTGF